MYCRYRSKTDRKVHICYTICTSRIFSHVNILQYIRLSCSDRSRQQSIVSLLGRRYNSYSITLQPPGFLVLLPIILSAWCQLFRDILVICENSDNLFTFPRSFVTHRTPFIRTSFVSPYEMKVSLFAATKFPL